MMSFTRIGGMALALLAIAVPGLAQVPQAATSPSVATTAPASSAMSAELFYQLLLGELEASTDDPGTGFSLVLDAARKTGDPALYQRAVEIALQARAGDAALQAARAWKQAQPTSREANRYVLQILLALNRVSESIEPLKAEIAMTPVVERNAAIAALPRLYGRSTDKKQAATLVEQALAGAIAERGTASAAWTTIGRMRDAAGEPAAAIEAARRAQEANPEGEGPALLALELMDPQWPQAEAMVQKYLARADALPEMRMAYARALLDQQRLADAQVQLDKVTAQKPDFPDAWLVKGLLLMQDNKPQPAEQALQRYLALAAADPDKAEGRSRGLAQAYLALSQIAEKRNDFAQANAWLDKIEDSQQLVSVQVRRASLLAQQGKLNEGMQLLQALPARTPAEARTRLMAQVQLLRDNKQYRSAYDLLTRAGTRTPQDTDILYEQAMLADKLGELGTMERLLRAAIALKPDFSAAYNALGYSLADRNVRLPEARQLVQKALEYAPGDPFITDSLAWVTFRMGNRAEALRLLEEAYKKRPDAEIAAHMGEVLWESGQRDRAVAVWREGLKLNADNETLQQTLKRFKVKP